MPIDFADYLHCHVYAVVANILIVLVRVKVHFQFIVIFAEYIQVEYEMVDLKAGRVLKRETLESQSMIEMVQAEPILQEVG